MTLSSFLSYFNFQKHGFRHLTSLPEWSHLLCLYELLPRPCHHRLWAQLLPSLPGPLLGGSPNSNVLPWVQRSIREARFQNQHRTKEPGFHCQRGQSSQCQQLWGADLCGTQRSKGALLQGWKEAALCALLWVPRACVSQSQPSTVVCWGIQGRCNVIALGSKMREKGENDDEDVDNNGDSGDGPVCM